MLVLLVMILRTVAIEFRSKEQSPRWRSTWDTVFWRLARAGAAPRRGLRQHPSGVPIDADGNITMSLIDLLKPFALLVGVTTVAMFATARSDLPDAQDRRRAAGPDPRALPRLMVVFFVLNTLVVVAMVLFRPADHDSLHERHLAGDLPGGRARRARSAHGGSCAAASRSGRSCASAAMIALLHRLRRDRALPESPHLVDRRRLQPDRHERGVGREHAPGVRSSSPSSGCRSCFSTLPASTASSGARRRSGRTATEPAARGVRPV